jgi:rhodanese-related sulfurtransferase
MGVAIAGAVVALALAGVRVAQAGEGGCAGGVCSLAPASATPSGLTAEEQRAAEKLRADGLGFISAKELADRIATGKSPVIVDVLAPADFAQRHVKGAINIPYKEVGALAPKLLPDKTAEIVVYCGSFKCPASTAAGKALKELGYTNIRDYKGGIKEWTDKGLPAEGTAIK